MFERKQIVGKSPAGDRGNCFASRCLFYWLWWVYKQVHRNFRWQQQLSI